MLLEIEMKKVEMKVEGLGEEFAVGRDAAVANTRIKALGLDSAKNAFRPSRDGVWYQACQ